MTVHPAGVSSVSTEPPAENPRTSPEGTGERLGHALRDNSRDAPLPVPDELVQRCRTEADYCYRTYADDPNTDIDTALRRAQETLNAAADALEAQRRKIAELEQEQRQWEQDENRELDDALAKLTLAEAVVGAAEKAKDGAYLERNQVVAALAATVIANGGVAGIARTAIEGWSEDWHGCVYIELPTGQASWHYHDSQAHLFSFLPPYAGKWDGHTTPEKYARLQALSAYREKE